MKYTLIQQYSQEDCGAACLASVVKHYGRTVGMNRIREIIGTGRLGTTLLGLRRGATALGLRARSAIASPEILTRLEQLPLPAILHWQGKHWVLLYGQRGNQYIIADPGVGVRYLTHEELTEAWVDRVILLLEPDPVHFAQEDESIPGLERLWLRLAPYRGILLEAVVCTAVIGLLSLASPIFIQILTDDVLIRGDTRLLVGVLTAVITLYLVRSALAFVAENLIANFAQRLELGFVMEFGQQILRLPLMYYETRRSGEVVSRLGDIAEVNRLVSEAVISLPSSILIAAVSLGLMLFYSWKLTLVGILVAIAMTLSTIIFQPALRQKTRRAMVLDTENQGVLVEIFKGALTLKTTNAAPQFWDELQSRFGRLANLVYGTTQIGIINGTFSEVVAEIGSAAMLGVGSLLVINQELSIGQLLAFTTLNRNVVGLISEIVSYVDDWIRVQTANTRLQEVVSATPESPHDEKKNWVTLPDGVDITCADLTFHYPGRVELLKHLSLHLPGGQAIALIGRSGCGKSTLAKVIAGLYPPQSGQVHYGSYNLHDLALECVRQQVVLVPQETHFWSRSILENFRMGDPTLAFEQIVQACQITGADDFIRHLPETYQTTLGEFGSNLSGGQRQRLAIARAIVHNPAILILDESTSGLDPVSEAELLDKLLWHRQGKTTLLISHRPRVIRLADWIVFFENGQVKAAGTSAELRLLEGDHLNFLD